MIPALEPGIFCKTFGLTPRNQILEWFVEMSGIEYDTGQLQEYTKLQPEIIHSILQQLVKEKLLLATRKSKGQQLYTFNKEHPLSALLIELDKAYTQMTMNNHIQKYPQKKITA